MMPPLFHLLQASSPVKALLGANPLRVFPWGEAPEGTEYPYATYGVPSGTPENTLDSVPTVDRLLTQVDVWAKTGASCLDAAAAIRDEIEPKAHLISLGNLERDPETKSYRLRMDFDFFTFR